MYKYFLLLLLWSSSINALVITHGTDLTSTDTGSSTSFNSAEYLFSSVFADTLTISNIGGGVAHDHNTNANLEIDIFNGSVWSNIFSTSLSGTGFSFTPNLSTLISSPISFTGTNISGIRLGGDIAVNQMYHSIESSMTYELSEISEPSALALFSLGLIGIRIWRQRKVN